MTAPHGGARPGAGRKPGVLGPRKADTVQLTVRISRKADAALRAQADQAGVPLGKLIERLIEKN